MFHNRMPQQAETTMPPLQYPPFNCAVRYHRLDTPDFFRKQSDGWFLGVQQRHGGTRRTVQFLDGSCDPHVPTDATIVPLQQNENNAYTSADGSVQVVVPNEHQTMQSPSPPVQLGDLVFGLYQRGARTKIPAWFRGRVAKVNSNNDFVDIAYDDGEYECNVPIAYTIRIVQSISDRTWWLQGVTVPIPGHARRHGRTTLTTESATAHVLETGAIQLRYKCKEETWDKRKPYQGIVQALMKDCKSLATQVSQWPETPPPKTRLITPDAIHTASNKKVKQKATTETKRKRTSEPKRKNIVEPETPQVTTSRVTRRGTRAAAVDQRRLCFPTSDIAAVPDDPRVLEALPRLPERSTKGHTMQAADAVVYGKVWTGCDTGLAKDWLYYLADRHGCVPNKDMWMQLFDLMAHGPKSDGGAYPDVRKLTLALEYVEKIIAKAGLDLSDEPLWEDDIADTVLTHAQSRLYGDGAHRNATMHAKMCAVRILKHILEASLLQEGNPDDTMHRLQFRNPPKHYLTEALAARASVSGLVMDDRCALYDLQRDLGTCISYFGWWYSTTANEDADALADLIARHHPTELGLLHHLVPSLLPQVRPKVAERWGIAEDYNLVYG